MNKYAKTELIIFCFLIGFAIGGATTCVVLDNWVNEPIEIVKDK